MKKHFTLLLLAIFGFLAVSCTERDDLVTDKDTYSVVYDIKNINFSYNATNGYFISKTFNNPLYDSDVVLIYRQNGTTNNGAPIWQKIPRTLYLSGGNELDYDYDFSKFDIMIFANGNYDISTTPQYLNNQTFRVVIVPASFGKGGVDTNDYNAVIKYYNINESNIKTL